MPDIIQLADNEADVKEQQQAHCADLVPDLHILAHQVQEAQKDRTYTCIDIGQTFLEVQFHTAGHIARHLTHGIQEAFPGIIVCNIQVEALGELVDAGLGGLQGSQGGQFQNGGHADGQQREDRDPAQVQEKALNTFRPADLIADKQQQNKNTGEEAHIVIGEDGQEQCQRVQQKFFIPQQSNGSQGHQGQQRKGIQPHQIPLEAQRPGAQAVKSTEQGDGQVVLMEHLLQKQRKKQAGKSQLYGNQQRIEFQQNGFRHQNTEQIQGGCQVIGDQTQIIHAQAYTPGIHERIAAEQGLPESLEEGIILVIHIGIEHGVGSKRLTLTHKHHKQHPHKGQHKGQRRIIPLDILCLVQIHSHSPRGFSKYLILYHGFLPW